MRPATLLLGAALIALPVIAYATAPSSAPASRNSAPAAALARAFAEACDWTELALPTGYARPDVHAAGGHGVYAGLCRHPLHERLPDAADPRHFRHDDLRQRR